MPNTQLSAIEINAKASDQLKEISYVDIRNQSILEFEPERQWDLSLTKGVLIHIAPERLVDVYDRLYRSSSHYICIAEYYNPTPVEVTYRGHANRLFKRDFAGELMDRFSDLSLVDYGFVWHRDPTFPADDVNWFLLEKK